LAKLCLEKSRASQLTNAYFDEVASSLDKLIKEAEEKCCQKETSVELLSKFIKKFLLIVSRVARLLECLEFDPLEFCYLLDAAEAQARQVVKTDIPKYIISKLGLNRDPFEEFAASIMNNNNNNEMNSSTNQLDSGLTTTTGSADSNSFNLSNSSTTLARRNQTPSEEDFEQIKLISNGAYG
jgi:microtubule-associated serine/threonine kinase